MGALDVFTFAVLAVLLGVAVFAAFKLGALPGEIAARREHPQADAIRVAGWLGLVTLGLLWPFALIWAYTRPGGADARGLEERVDGLSERVAALEDEGRGGPAA
jgi:hypothetical protein